MNSAPAAGAGSRYSPEKGAGTDVRVAVGELSAPARSTASTSLRARGFSRRKPASAGWSAERRVHPLVRLAPRDHFGVTEPRAEPLQILRA